MDGKPPNAWQVVKRGGTIRATDLLRAIADPQTSNSSEHRTGLLVRDAAKALSKLWGEATFLNRLALLGAPEIVAKRLHEPQDEEVGFPSLEYRTMEATDRNDVLAMLRELGQYIRQPAKLVIGGSIALIMDSVIIDATEDIDVVNELPAVIRNEHALLQSYVERYGLKLTHFQSHYLPDGWESRLRSLDRFGSIDVFLVERYDILAGKLFSRRSKDLDHVRNALKLLDESSFRDRIQRSTAKFREDDRILEAGRRNWYVLTGEADLPPLISE